MGTTKATKAADKSQVCRKFVSALHKLYGKSVPKIELPVVETMLFATCLEDNPWEPAEAGLKKLLSSFFDLNEIRVSSVNELEAVLLPLGDADWKGLRIRSILRSVFEATYSYDFEKLRRQTMEQAVKTLKKMQDVTPFIRDFVLHEILGSHLVCMDNSMLTAAKWLGLVPASCDQHEASEFLKAGLKKSEISEFCYLLRCLATDPKFVPRFADHAESEQSMADVMTRFAELQLPPKKKPAKPPAPKEAPKPAKVVKSEVSKKPVPAASGRSAASTPAVSAKTKVAKVSNTSAKPPKKAETSKTVPKKTATTTAKKGTNSRTSKPTKPVKKK
ncbi:MAG: hypothetical protein KDB01_00715 [Planctomycetaceae bacterium]|nr:hypothetical protein [Planctomycetaceae bacterium]